MTGADGANDGYRDILEWLVLLLLAIAVVMVGVVMTTENPLILDLISEAMLYFIVTRDNLCAVFFLKWKEAKER